MKLNELPKTTEARLRRLGQGHGSGRGKTSGRGTKGQKARNSVDIFFEGGALPLTKRIPFLRGRGRNPGSTKTPIAINTSKLNGFKSGSKVDLDSIVKMGIADAVSTRYGVKIIGNGDLTVSLTVALPTSAGAKKIIEKAGGQVEA